MEEKILNHSDCQNLQQNHFKSAMLLPSCAFVFRNVHLCQSFPLISLTSQCVHHPTCRQTVVSASDRSVCHKLLLTTVQSQWHRRLLLLLSTVQHPVVSSLQQINLSLLQEDDELHCLNALLGHQIHTVAQSQNITSDRYELMKDRDQCVEVSSSWIVFFFF